MLILHAVVVQLKGKTVKYFGYTFMSRNRQSRKYLIGRSYRNDEFAWPFDLVIVT